MVLRLFGGAIASLLAVTIAGCGSVLGGDHAANPPATDSLGRSVAILPQDADRCSEGVADVGTYRGDAARTGRMPGPSLTGTPVTEWTYAADGALTSSPALIDGVLFQGSAAGTLYALDLEGGTARWSVDLGAAISSPTGVDSRVIVGLSSGDVVALNRADGSIAWQRTVGGQLLGAPALDDGSLVVASTAVIVDAIEPKSGLVRWKARLDGEITRSPAIDGSVLIVPLEPGGVVAVDVTTGRTLWRAVVAADGGVGTPAIADGLVLTAAGLDAAAPSERAIVALDLKSGDVAWRWSTRDQDRVYSPAVESGRAFVVDESGGVTALDIQTGHDVWRVSRGQSIEAVAATTGDSVLVVSNRGAAASLDFSTGATNWEVPIRGVPYGPIASCGWVVVPTNLGTLTALLVSS